MEKTEAMKALRKLREIINSLRAEDVDDAEDILTELAIGSDDYVAALDAILNEV